MDEPKSSDSDVRDDIMKIKGNITASDHVYAAYLHLRPRPIMAVVGTLFLLLYIAIATLSIVIAPKESYTIVMLLCLAWLFFHFVIFIPLKVRSEFRKNKFKDHETTYTFDDEGILMASDLGESRIPWDHLRMWKRNKRYLLFYPASSLYLVFPTRLFKEDQLEEILSLANSRIEKKL